MQFKPAVDRPNGYCEQSPAGHWTDAFVVPDVTLNVAQVQKTQPKVPVALVGSFSGVFNILSGNGQTFQPVRDLFVLVAQHCAVTVAGVTDLERTANHLNNRPRKTLGFLSPARKLEQLLQ